MAALEPRQRAVGHLRPTCQFLECQSLTLTLLSDEGTKLRRPGVWGPTSNCHISKNINVISRQKVVLFYRILRLMSYSAESLLWPHLPDVEGDAGASLLLSKLRKKLEAVPIERFETPAQFGRWLGAEVLLSPLRRPRRGWTWFRKNGISIEVADWLPHDIQWLVAAHEVSHVLLGPSWEPHNPRVERVCNWGADRILERIRGLPTLGHVPGRSVELVPCLPE